MNTKQFRIIRSSSNRALAIGLAERLRLDVQGLDPFVPLSIAVDTPSTGAWLRDIIAAEHGIAMNSVYPLVGGAIESALGTTLGFGLEEEALAAAWKTGPLTWQVLDLLAELGADGDPSLDVLRRYLGLDADAGSAPAEPRAWSLATRVAATFDRYLIHRPTLVAAWLDGADDPAAALDVRWQAELMRRLAGRLGRPEHRLWAARGRRTAEGLSPVIDDGTRVEPLHIFAITTLPTAILYWLWLIAHTRDVFVFVRSPADALPGFGLDGDPSTDGPRGLAASLGAMAAGVTELERTLLAVEAGDRTADGVPAPFAFFAMPPGHEARPSPTVDLEEALVPDALDGDPSQPPSLLRVIQQSLRDGADPVVDDDWMRHRADADDSFQVHACYGLIRQAEVLRELVLGLLQDRPSLEPRDILVLSPDIEAHAPLLEAAFAAGRAPDANDEGPPRLPLRIMGRSAWRTNPYADLIVRLVRLASGRVTLTEVLDLIALDAVRRRFGLDEGDVARCRDLLIDAGARWGLDASHRAAFGLPPSDEFSWSFVLERIAAGVLLAEDAELVDWPLGDAIVAPLTGLEGGEQAWLGGLVAFLRALVAWLPRIASATPGDGRGARSVDAWVAFVAGPRDSDDVGARAWGGLLGAFAAPGDDSWQWEALMTGLAAMEREAAGTRMAMTPEAFIMAFEAQFAEPVRGTLGSPSAAGVTLAALTTAAGLPARVVVLFGFDQDAWPRVGERPGFDLMGLHPRPGDPDIRKHQRGAFVDAVMQAEETLIITYAGRDPVSDDALAPAVVVVELLEALDTSLSARGQPRVSRQVTRLHPLQPFSEANFDAHRPFGHDPALMRAASARRSRTPRAAVVPAPPVDAPAVATGTVAMDLAQLESHLRDPARAFVREALGLYRASFSEGARLDREPIGLGQPALGGSGRSYEIWRDAVLADPRTERVRIQPVPAGALETRFRALGALPPGRAGQRVLGAIDRFARAQTEAFAKEFGGHPETPTDVSLALDGIGFDEGGLELPSRVVLTGRITAQRADAMVGLTRSAPANASLLPLWVKALIARALPASDAPAAARLVVIGKSSGKSLVKVKSHSLAGAFARHGPTDHLKDLVAIALASRRYPVPLFRRASLAFVEALAKREAGALRPAAEVSGSPAAFWAAHFEACREATEGRIAEAFAKAWDAFAGGAFDGGAVPDRASPNTMDLFGNLTSLDPRVDPRAAVAGAGDAWSFPVLALRVWGPLLLTSNDEPANGEGES